MNDVLKLPLPGTLVDPRYPDSNGRSMGETDYHNVATIFLREGLEDHFVDWPDVYVASNLVFYWKQGDARRRRDPDVLVAKGVAGKHRRRSYRLWEEGIVPCTLFEIASLRTWRVDLRIKPELYISIGVKEYFLFDPEGKYLDPVLQGFRSVKGQLQKMKPNKDGSLVSKQLGLRFVPEGEILRPIDLVTNEPVLTRSERAELQSQRVAELEMELRRLKKLLDGKAK